MDYSPPGSSSMDFFRQSLKYACVCVCTCALSVAQLCPTLCDLMDCSRQAPSPWNFPGKVLKISVCTQLLSRVRLFVTPWTVAHQAPLSVGFSRQKYRSGLPFLHQGILKITIVAIYDNEYIDVHHQCLEFTHKVKCGRENLLWVGVDSAGTVRNFNSQAVKKIEAVN